MKLRSWSVAALALCALTIGRVNAQEKKNEALEPQAETLMQEPEPADEGSYDPAVRHEYLDDHHGEAYGDYHGDGACVEDCEDGADCGNGGGMFSGMMSRPVSLVFGAEFIYARASFSDALAYVSQDATALGETWVEFDFDAKPSYSFYGGIYLPDCGGSLIFDYTRLQSDADIAATSTATNQIFGMFEIDDNITGHADVDLKSYDLAFTKAIPLGCPLECPKACGDTCDECADSCCDSCCGRCPAWDLEFSAGVRYADVDWNRGLTATVPQTGLFEDGFNTHMNFEGFGGRAGVLGRRYIGRRGLFSIYGKADWSVLFGDMEVETLVTNQAGTAFERSKGDRIIPVTEIELGGTAHLGSHVNLSAGYFWAAWHDLGMRETYDFNRFQISHYDDANILGFDGLFARAEVLF